MFRILRSKKNPYLLDQAPSPQKFKRMWFVLKDHVLYSYRAPEDTAAVDTCPVLGFDLEVESEVSEGSLTRREKTAASRGGFELDFCGLGLGRVGFWKCELGPGRV